MFWHREERTPGRFYQPHRRWYYACVCSRGHAKIAPIWNEQQVPPTIKGWRWVVTCKRQLKVLDQQGKPVVQTRTFEGTSTKLYHAAQECLQRLFTQRRQPLYKLMKMLGDDQAMYELAMIGG